ncbi:autorepressor SdpR family transcription factor [Chloroflexus aggregans]|uniref:Transcriptional regulator, ArsR family n=1 Tax=Chloroflexus aggregans (strain MD-66 / DSM 9485) TaxID=326427 RepID=B8G4F8_CHLAD|nr:autorepressor SdpR family transcription factor [Chloroflexus aggregans]ACL23564.1 transcriptional regulator, ArsR family [Chloroflexus aggregans DSM 9485]
MEQAITRTLHALSDPTRRAILQMLNERDMTAGEIAARFAISAPSVSHHLSVLKAVDLVTAERHGQHMIYRLNTTVLQEVLSLLMDLFKVGVDADTQRKEGGHA